MPAAPFSEFAAVCEQLGKTTSRLERARLVGAYLRQQTPEQAEVTSRWLIGRVFPEAEGRRLALSGRAVWAALEQMGIDVQAAHWAGAEDFGELVRQLMPAAPPDDRRLFIEDLVDTFAAIAAASGSGSRQLRIGLLSDVLRRATPLEAKYLVKIVIGEMRHGVQEGIVLDAIAGLCDASASEIRRAHQALGDIGRLAALAKSGGIGGLAAVTVQLFRPIKPMLAQTATDVAGALAELQGRCALEWKLDGARVQIHKQGDRIQLFSRHLQDMTASLPEIVDAVRMHARAHTAIFEGEVIPMADGRPLPFQELMRRFRRTRDVSLAATQVPVQLFLFDILQRGDSVLLTAPAAARWEALESARGGLECVARLLPVGVAEGEAFYQAAVAAGYEGVMAKALEAPYTPGMRGKGWLKIKKIVSLDLVIVAADWGYGRRHGWLSNYHLAVRDETNGAFVPVGKTFKGLTDEQFRAMTERLLLLKVHEERGTVLVRPEVVVEVRFTDIQKSPQYACRMALRFARIFRIRDDKSPNDADTLATLRALYARSSEMP